MNIESDKKDIKTEALSMVIDLNNVILAKWNNAIDQVVKRQFYKSKGADVWKEEVATAVYNLYYSVRISFCNDTAEPTEGSSHKNVSKRLNDIEDVFSSQDVDLIIKIFNELDAWLYKKGVTKFDTRSVYNKQIAEMANRARGL